eukprot:SAG22_NODE_312_length_12614_cov_4.783540_4_plen_237_part_00
MPDAVQPAFLATVTDNFDSRDALTPAGARNAMQAVLDNHPVFARMTGSADRLEQGAADGGAQLMLQQGGGRAEGGGGSGNDPPTGPEQFSWGGKLGKLTPAGWKFPSSTVQPAWVSWLCGGVFTVEGTVCWVVPWRKLKASDIQNKSQKARLRDIKGLFKPLETHLADEHNVTEAQLQMATPETANELFLKRKAQIAVPEETNAGRKRHRVDQLTWAVHLDLYRKRLRALEPEGAQ